MTNQEKDIICIVKKCLDEARQKIDIVRFGGADDEEYKKLTEIHGILCDATDKIYNV